MNCLQLFNNSSNKVIVDCVTICQDVKDECFCICLKDLPGKQAHLKDIVLIVYLVLGWLVMLYMLFEYNRSKRNQNEKSKN